MLSSDFQSFTVSGVGGSPGGTSTLSEEKGREDGGRDCVRGDQDGGKQSGYKVNF